MIVLRERLNSDIVYTWYFIHISFFCGIGQIQSRMLPQMINQYQSLRVSQNKNTYQNMFQQRLTDWIHGILLTECKRTLQIMNSLRWSLNLRIKHDYVIIYSVQFIIKPTTSSNFFVFFKMLSITLKCSYTLYTIYHILDFNFTLSDFCILYNFPAIW